MSAYDPRLSSTIVHVPREARRGSAWLVAFAAVALVAGAILLARWSGSGGNAPAPAPVVMAPLAVTVVVTATATPTVAVTQTPYVVTATPTNTALAYPFCDYALPAGTACLAVPKSPTPPPLPTCKADLTSFGSVCTVPGDPGLTDGSQETQ